MKKYEVLSPSCFKHFSCKGSECRINCCSEWRITLSKEEYKETKKKRPDAEKFIRQSQVENNANKIVYEMILDEDKSCPYLTKDKHLCALQLEFGPSILSNTCTEFPRTYYKYLNKLEAGLSLGCERVLEILLEEKNHLLLSNSIRQFKDNQLFAGIIDEKLRKKYPALLYYYDIQALCLSMMQAEEASIEDRLILLGMALLQIDKLADSGNAKEIPEYIRKFEQGIEDIDAVTQIGNIKGATPAVLYNNLLVAKKYITSDSPHYEKLMNDISERLNVEITTVPSAEDKNVYEGNIKCSEEIYNACQKTYRQFMKNREYFLENFMIAWMFQRNAPFSCPENGVWKDYTFFVWGFSMVKFALTATLRENSTEEDMIDCCVTIFRKIGHNKEIYNRIVSDFEKNKSNTPAHMAILIKS